VLDSPEVQQMMRAPIVLDDEEDEEPLHAGPPSPSLSVRDACHRFVAVKVHRTCNGNIMWQIICRNQTWCLVCLQKNHTVLLLGRHVCDLKLFLAVVLRNDITP
jgi:hypothetical protein